MRILIVAAPRTGSSELCSRLSRYLNLSMYQEPFHPTRNMLLSGKAISYNLEDNAVVKCLILQVPKGYDELKPVEFYEEYSKNFDKVILLLRKDVVAQIKSFSFMIAQKGTGFRGDKPYTYTEQDNYEEAKNGILLYNELVKNLGIRLGIPPIFLEDLYGDDKGPLKQDKKQTI